MPRSQADCIYGVVRSFVLSAEDLKTLFEALNAFSDDLNITAQCADDVTRTFTPKTLKDFRNARNERIKKLTISAQRPDNRGSARVTFDAEGLFAWCSPISVSLSGPEDSVLALRTKLDKIFEACEPWYDRLARVDIIGSALLFGPLCIFLIAFGASAGALGDGWLRQSAASISSRPNVWAVSAISLTIAAGCFWVGVTASRYRRLLFPLGVFAINKGAERHRTQESWRMMVIAGVVLAVPVGILVNGISAAFF